MIGQTINNYLIERKLGEGGMSEVFFARHNRIHRTVAIKILHKNLFSNELVRNRFKNEANALIKLEHPNILKIYDYIEQENLACLIVEYIDGITLDTFINKFSGPLPDVKAIVLFNSILDAVQYAHYNNILHRDIKPGNIMISRDGKMVKVMDFGIAKFTDTLSPKVTHLNSQLGTPYYMSPEQVKGLPYSALSDIYSLGVTLFEMSTGKCPYFGITTLFELHTKIVNDPLPPTDLYYPDVSVKLQEAIKIATNKSPLERFKSCTEFKEFLQKEDSAITAEQTSEQFYVTQRQALQRTMVLQEEKINGKGKNRKLLWSSIAVVSVIAVLIIGFILKEQNSKYNFSKTNTDSLISNNKNNNLINPVIDSLIFSKKADSLIYSYETITNTLIKDGTKKDELKEKLISALNTNAPNTSLTTIIKVYSKYFLPLQTKPSINAPVSTVLMAPPSKSVVLADLTNHRLSNGINYSIDAEDSFSPGEFNNENPPLSWTASLTFKRNDTVYKATVNYQKEGSIYKYSSNSCSIISVPKEAESDVSTTVTNIKNDFLKYLHKEGKLCTAKFTNDRDISEFKIGSKKEDAYSNIIYAVEFLFKDQKYTATIFYQLKPGKSNNYFFNKVKINNC